MQTWERAGQSKSWRIHRERKSLCKMIDGIPAAQSGDGGAGRGRAVQGRILRNVMRSAGASRWHADKPAVGNRSQARGPVLLHSLFPGTRINRTQMAASIRSVQARTIRERLTSSFRTYVSRMREKLKGVYSVKPSKAIMGSRAYWYEARKYTATEKGRISYYAGQY